MAEWSMAVVLKTVQGWEGRRLLPTHADEHARNVERFYCGMVRFGNGSRTKDGH